jgi:hypothetical protein
VATIVTLYVLWTAAWCSSPNWLFSWGDVLKQMVWFCQVLVIIGRSSEFAWPEFARAFWNWLAVVFAQGELGSVPAIQCLWGTQLTAKLPWGLWRGLLPAILIVIWIIGLMAMHMLIVGMLVWCGVTAAKPPSDSADDTLSKAGRACKLACSKLGEAVGLQQSKRSLRDWWQELEDRFRILAYVALSFFYPVLLRISLGSFFCIEFEGQQLWSVDMSMTCWTREHLIWVVCIGAFVGFVLTVLLPIFYNFTWIAANKQRRCSQSRHSTRRQAAVQSWGKMLSTIPGVIRVPFQKCHVREHLLKVLRVLA